MGSKQGYVTLSAPLKVFFDVTSRCNLDCSFCYKPVSSSAPSAATLERILRAIADAGVVEVILAGGEPFTLEEPFRIFHLAKEMGLRTGFISNGTLITASVAQQCATCVDGCAISFHGPNASVYDSLTRVDGAFEDAVRGLRNLNRNGIVPGILYTPTRDNVGELLNTVAFLMRAGIRVSSIQVNRLIPAGRAREYWSKINCGIQEYEHLLQQMHESALRWPEVRMETGDAFPLCLFSEEYHPFVVRCNYGITIGGIDERGWLKRCPCRIARLGNILEIPLKNLWTESPFLRSFRNLELLPEVCRSCGALAICGGGCLCSGDDDMGCPDALLDGRILRQITLPSHEMAAERARPDSQTVPHVEIDYIVRRERGLWLSVPLGEQDIFHDTMVPRDAEFPLLWLDDLEKDVLSEIDGHRSIADIARKVGLSRGLGEFKATNMTCDAVGDFIAFNYVAASRKDT